MYDYLITRIRRFGRVYSFSKLPKVNFHFVECFWYFIVLMTYKYLIWILPLSLGEPVKKKRLPLKCSDICKQTLIYLKLNAGCHCQLHYSGQILVSVFLPLSLLFQLFLSGFESHFPELNRLLLLLTDRCFQLMMLVHVSRTT